MKKWTTTASLSLFLSCAITSAQDQAPATRPATTRPAAASAKSPRADEKQLPITITGGHDTDPRDHGRPVILIASALKVPEEVFRETFTHVRPAGLDRGGPTPEEARRNKEALMRGLGPYGVTNDRLDTVSNFYRYNGSKGQMWRNTPAAAYVTVRNGAVVSITLTNAGAGYTSQPQLTIAGMENVTLKATLAYGTDFATNGSLKEISIVPPAGK